MAAEPDACVPDFTESYEQLRHRALAGDAEGFRFGMAVLQRTGVVAWMRAWHEPAPVLRKVAPAARGRDGDAVLSVLASMAIACARGISVS